MTNKPFQLIILLITGLFLIVGCRVSVTPVKTHCKDWDDLTTEEQIFIESTSKELLQNISESNFDEVWSQSHPLLQKQLSKEQFTQAMKDFRLRLGEAEGIEIVDGRFATIDGAKTANRNIICGGVSVEEPNHLRIQVQIPTERVAIAILRVPGEPIERQVSIQLAEDNGMYKIAGLNITSAIYKGKDATHYAEIGAGWIDEGKHLAGYLAYAMAQNLSHRGGFLQTGQNIILTEKFLSLNRDEKIQNNLGNWKVDGNNYQIVRVSLIETLGDISPHIAYISNENLDEKVTSVEAHQLMQFVEEEHPELSEEFDAILFEAFSEMPTDPNKSYPSYRVPIYFE